MVIQGFKDSEFNRISASTSDVQAARGLLVSLVNIGEASSEGCVQVSKAVIDRSHHVASYFHNGAAILLAI